MTPIFTILDWREDGLARLAELLLEATDGRPERALVIAPHRRPRRYLIRALLDHPDVTPPLLLPEVWSAGECFTRLASLLPQADGTGGAGDARRTITGLDQTGVMAETLRLLAREDAGLGAFPVDDPGRLFPWAVRLARLMEEVARHAPLGRLPDIAHMEGEVDDFAAALLARLARIQHRYRTLLDERGLTTPGLTAGEIADRAEEAAELLLEREVFLFGFHAPSAVEARLFQALGERGARIICQADPDLTHPACEPIRRWARHAGASYVHLPSKILDNPAPEVRFIEGFDLHSQLDGLAGELAAQGPRTSAKDYADTAIVAPSASLLLPLLHQLPVKDPNVSMGFPLARAPLPRLIEALLAAREAARELPDGSLSFHTQTLLPVLRHPYVRLLAKHGAGDDEELAQATFSALAALERCCIEEGPALTLGPLLEAWQRPEYAVPILLELDPARSARLGELLSTLLDTCFGAFQSVTCLADLAQALDRLCVLCLEAGTPADDGAPSLWDRFPIDAECLHRLLHSVIPALATSALSQEPMGMRAAFSVAREVLEHERTPFEAEPIEGLQILGFLEARCLNFKRIYVLDATETNLPGAPGADPLLPDPLRRYLKLPDRDARETDMAYHFKRLLAGAKEAVLLYQVGVAKGVLDEKSVRSRYVEELIWRTEQARGERITPGTPPLASISYPIRPIAVSRASVAKSETVQAALAQRLARPLSPSALDLYLRCPAQFFYQEVARLKPRQEPKTEDDPAELGSLVHAVLHDLLVPFTGREISDTDLPDDEELGSAYVAALRASGLYRRMSLDSRFLAEEAGRRRLKLFRENLPRTTILALERGYTARIEGSHGVLDLSGRVDRLDRREDGLLVLDYKTGSVHLPKRTFFEEGAFWQLLGPWREEPGTAEDPLPVLAEELVSVQLPCYLEFVRQSGETPGNAALVELKDAAKEYPLLPDAITRDAEAHGRVVTEQIPALLAFLTDHLRQSPSFGPREGKHCDYCAYADLCRIG